jgi:hypothetical protein
MRTSWLRRWWLNTVRRPARRRTGAPSRSRLWLEALEGRLVPAGLPLPGGGPVPGGGASFAAPQSFETGWGPFSVAVGDLNRDGKADLVVANAFDYENYSVSVLMNTTAPGAAAASFADQITFPTGARPVSVVLGDLNGDGKLDIVVSNGFDNTVSVLMNTTPAGAAVPTFAPQVTFATGPAPAGLALGDLNGDGELDIVVANENPSGPGSVSVLLNTTAPGAAVPSFAPQVSYDVGGEPLSVALGDLTGSGRLDIVVGNDASGSVSVLTNTTPTGTAAPSFSPAVSFAANGYPNSVALADLNGDGQPDIVVADNSGGVDVLMNQTPAGAAAPSFAPQQNLAVNSLPSDSVAVRDVNGDGTPDIVLTGGSPAGVSVFANQTAPGASSASFADPQVLNASGVPVFATLADLNGDGLPDLVVADDIKHVLVLMNTATPPVTPGPSGATGGPIHGPAAVAHPAFVSPATAHFVIGQAGNFAITTSGLPGDVLSVKGGHLPRGVSFKDNGNGTATLRGTPAAGAGGTYSVTIVASKGRSSVTQTVVLTVTQPAIVSAAGVTFSTGKANTFTITTAGFPTGKITESGALPSGVTLVSKGNGTAVLSGKPTKPGSYSFTIKVSESGLPPAVQTFHLIVA